MNEMNKSFYMSMRIYISVRQSIILLPSVSPRTGTCPQSHVELVAHRFFLPLLFFQVETRSTSTSACLRAYGVEFGGAQGRSGSLEGARRPLTARDEKRGKQLANLFFVEREDRRVTKNVFDIRMTILDISCPFY